MKNYENEAGILKDYYEVLGLSRLDSEEEIKRAYRLRAKQYHPDVSSTIAAEGKFKQIQEAYDVLGDPAQKRLYDQVYDTQEATGVHQSPEETDPTNRNEDRDPRLYPKKSRLVQRKRSNWTLGCLRILLKIILFPLTLFLSLFCRIGIFLVVSCGAILSIFSGILGLFSLIAWGGYLGWLDTLMGLGGERGNTLDLVSAVMITFLAFLLSPWGLPSLFAWIINKIDDLNQVLKSI